MGVARIRQHLQLMMQVISKTGHGGQIWQESNLQADWIAIGTVKNVVQISSIDYVTNTITLASPMIWADGASIWLYKKSDGVQVLYGKGPDMGAHEYYVLFPRRTFRKQNEMYRPASAYIAAKLLKKAKSSGFSLN